MSERPAALDAIYQELSLNLSQVKEQLTAQKKRLAELREARRLTEAQLALLDRLRSPEPAPAEVQRLTVTARLHKQPKRKRGNVRRAILRLLATESDLTSSQIADRLEGVVHSSSAKPIRRVITNNVYALRQDGRLTEAGGKLRLAEASNGTHA